MSELLQLAISNGTDIEPFSGEELSFHESFNELIVLVTTVRFGYVIKNTDMKAVAIEKIEANVQQFREYAIFLKNELNPHYKAKCDIADDYEELSKIMISVATNVTSSAQVKSMPNLHKSLQAIGFISLTRQEEKSIDQMWETFKLSFVEYIQESKSGVNGEKAQVLMMSAQIFSISVTRKSIKKDFERLDIDYGLSLQELIKDSPEEEQGVGFIITWTIDAYLMPRAEVRINWSYVNTMLHKVLTTLLSWNRYESAARAVNAFLGWYNIMNGSNDVIYSDNMKSWLMIGKVHVRTIATMLSRMPPNVSNNGQILRDFLGCRTGVNSWYIGIIEGILIFETNQAMVQQFRGFVDDLKRMCR